MGNFFTNRKINKVINKNLDPLFQKNKVLIKEMVNGDKEFFISKLRDKLNEAFEKVITLQKEENKDYIVFINITYSEEDIKNLDYNLKINCFNSDGYKDTKPIIVTYNMDFILNYYKRDIEFLENEVLLGKVKLKDNEIELIKNEYLNKYIKIIQSFLDFSKDNGAISNKLELIGKDDEEFGIYFGKYGEAGDVLYEKYFNLLVDGLSTPSEEDLYFNI